MSNINSYGFYSSTTQYSSDRIRYLFIHSGSSGVFIQTDSKQRSKCVRLIKENTTGGFSISSTLKADIAKSNLQFHCLNKEWRFAPNAYDVIGNDNSNIAENYNGYIDLFGFGTSGWNSGAICYQPWSSSTNDANYINHDLTGDYKNADWGVFAINKQLQDVAFTGDYNDLENKPDLTAYKTKQTAVVDPTASGTTLDVIDTITQNENGVITATKKTIQSATETQKGVAELATSTEAITGTDTERIMTPKTVKDAHDSRHWFGTQAQFDALAPDYDPNVIYHVENTEDTGITLHWTDDVATLASNNQLVTGDMYAKLPTGDTDKRNITNLYMATSSSTYITLWNL